METAPEKTGISKAERLFLIAQTIAEATPGFFTPIGAGKGNLRANTFMSELRRRAKEAFGQDYSEQYEKDIFKCLLAQDCGTKVCKLVFIARPGAAKVSGSPGRGAIAQFVREHFGIEVTVEELVDPALA